MPKEKVFLHNTENYCLYVVHMFSSVLYSDDDGHDFEALKVTEVPSALRIQLRPQYILKYSVFCFFKKLDIPV